MLYGGGVFGGGFVVWGYGWLGGGGWMVWGVCIGFELFIFIGLIWIWKDYVNEILIVLF